MPPLVDPISHKYIRVRKEWSLDNFDDGYIDNRGRFRVYLPNHPRAYQEGYILRAIVAYEVYTGDTVESQFDIHHKNKNRLDDSRDNLEKKLHGAHSIIHATREGSHIARACKVCGKSFLVERYRLNTRWHVGEYCTTTCYFKRGRSKGTVGRNTSRAG